MSFDVFISYSTKDAAAAKAACAALESARIRCWIAPRDILPSASWGASIVRAINECRVMVLIFSGNANASAQVHREVDQAFGKGKAVLPLRIEDIKPADELAYYLDTVHWLDALTPPLERNLEKLVATVRTLLPNLAVAPTDNEPVVDDPAAVRAQEAARAADERREQNDCGEQRTAALTQLEVEAAEAQRRKEEAEARRLVDAQRQEEKDEAERRKREEAKARERAEQERRAREAKARERAKQEAVAKSTPRPSRRAMIVGGSVVGVAGLAAIAVKVKMSPPSGLIRTFTGRHSNVVWSLAFAPDGRTALSGSADSTLKLWDVSAGAAIRTFTGHSGEVHSVAFAPDGRTALSGSGDTTLKLWDVSTAAAIRTFTGHADAVYSVVFAPDGRTAFSASKDGTLRVWDLSAGAAIRIEQTGGFRATAFAPDRRTALFGERNIVRLWDLSAGATTHSFAAAAPPHLVQSLVFAPDGRTALVGIDDGTLVLTDLTSGATIRTLTGRGGLALAFAPDGRSALSGERYVPLELWNVSTGTLIRTFTAHNSEGHNSSFFSVAFAPDGRSALSSDSDDLTLNLWDLARSA